MDQDRLESRRRQVSGSIKELIGKLIGNKQIEAEGAREKADPSDVRDPPAAPDLSRDNAD